MQTLWVLVTLPCRDANAVSDRQHRGQRHTSEVDSGRRRMTRPGSPFLFIDIHRRNLLLGRSGGQRFDAVVVRGRPKNLLAPSSGCTFLVSGPARRSYPGHSWVQAAGGCWTFRLPLLRRHHLGALVQVSRMNPSGSCSWSEVWR